jgi:hypothetical protein
MCLARREPNSGRWHRYSRSSQLGPGRRAQPVRRPGAGKSTAGQGTAADGFHKRGAAPCRPPLRSAPSEGVKPRNDPCLGTVSGSARSKIGVQPPAIFRQGHGLASCHLRPSPALERWSGSRRSRTAAPKRTYAPRCENAHRRGNTGLWWPAVSHEGAANGVSARPAWRLSASSRCFGVPRGKHVQARDGSYWPE